MNVIPTVKCSNETELYLFGCDVGWQTLTATRHTTPGRRARSSRVRVRRHNTTMIVAVSSLQD